MTSDQFKYLIAQARNGNGTYTRMFGQSGPPGAGEPPQGPAQMTNSDLSQQPPMLPQPQQSQHKNEGITYTQIVRKESGTKVAVIIDALISPVDATVLTIRTQLICVTFLMLIFALLLAFLISRKISKPIVKINESAKELARGKYETRFDASGYREISELGGTLDYAACELGKTEQLRRDLIANISHDLRTPLTMITGYAEVMRDLPGENTPENVQVIIDETNRLTSLVNDVLDLSRLESSTQEMKYEPFNLTMPGTTRWICSLYLFYEAPAKRRLIKFI